MITTMDFFVLLAPLLISPAAYLMISIWRRRRNRKVYLLGFFCYRAPPTYRTTATKFLEHAALDGRFTEEGLRFQRKVLERAGISNHSSSPPGVFQIPADLSLAASRCEVETVLFPTVESLLSRHGLRGEDIDVVVSNCSLYCPTPSISAMVARRFGMREDVRSYSLSGMGCSAGLLSVSLVKDLFAVHKECLALVVTMEAVGHSVYTGNHKNMLLPNCIFRMGGTAVLLSNRECDRWSAKYVLSHLVRTHMGADDKAYKSVYQDPDDVGIVGVSLSRDLLAVAGKALTENIATLGPKVLPYVEQIKYAVSFARVKLLPQRPANTRSWASLVYVPDFKQAFEHFCIHCGGRAVIDAIEERLRLRREDVEASRMTLYRFGNTSSSSVWYELDYLEAKGKVRKGDRIWQIGFGSGFKCNSAVWRCAREIPVNLLCSAWGGDIRGYPVDVPETMDI